VAAHHDVFQDGEVIKELHQLKGAGNAPGGDGMGWRP